MTLLAAVEHPEGQRAIREILRSPEATQDPAYPRMLSQLTFVKRPEPATLDLLEQRRASAGESGLAATYALGNALGNAYPDQREAVVPQGRRRRMVPPSPTAQTS